MDTVTVAAPPVPRRPSIQEAGAAAATKAKTGRPTAADRAQLMATAKAATMELRAEKDGAVADFAEEVR